MAQRVFDMHAENCPVYMTLTPCVDFDLELDLRTG